MEKFRPNQKKDRALIITTSIFLLLGILLISIGYGAKMADWVKKFGIVVVVITLPVINWLIYRIFARKAKEM